MPYNNSILRSSIKKRVRPPNLSAPSAGNIPALGRPLRPPKRRLRSAARQQVLTKVPVSVEPEEPAELGVYLDETQGDGDILRPKPPLGRILKFPKPLVEGSLTTYYNLRL